MLHRRLQCNSETHNSLGFCVLVIQQKQVVTILRENELNETDAISYLKKSTHVIDQNLFEIFIFSLLDALSISNVNIGYLTCFEHLWHQNGFYTWI